MASEVDYELSSSILQQGLHKLIQGGFLCDGQLCASGETFKIHKVVLAAASPYFEAMFTGGFNESEAYNIELKNVSATGLKIVLDAIYSCKLQMTSSTITNLLTTASFLQVQPILDICGKYMTSTLNITNCLHYQHLAEKYGLVEFVPQLQSFVWDHFSLICKDPSFLEVSPDTLCKYLKNDRLLCEESALFDALKNWFEYDSSRDRYVEQLFSNIRFGLLPLSKLLTVTDEVPGLQSCKELLNTLHEARQYCSNLQSQPLVQSYMTRPRGKDCMMILARDSVGVANTYAVYEGDDYVDRLGFYDVAISNDGSIAFDEEIEELNIPFADYSVQAVCLNDFVFLHGVDSRPFTTCMLRYDARSRKWATLAAVPQQASVSSNFVALNNGLVFCAGMLVTEKSGLPDTFVEDGVNIVGTTFVYNIEKNEWTAGQSMPHAAIFSGACVLDGLLYVIGGIDKPDDRNTEKGHEWGQIRSEVATFDLSRNRWLYVTCLNRKRFDCIAAALEHRILVVGGKSASTLEYSEMCELYNPTLDQWTIISAPFSTYGASLPVLVPSPEGLYLFWAVGDPTMWAFTLVNGELKLEKKVIQWTSNKNEKLDVMAVAPITMLHGLPNRKL